MKKIFRNRVCQWLFGVLPPAVGVGIANWASRRSRAVTGMNDEQFLGEDDEWLVVYCKEVLKLEHFDYFIFGHRHLPIDFNLGGSRYINLGDWIRYNTYAVFDGSELVLVPENPEMEGKIIRK
jgi:UDP-2,3-diacylglucosamine hydrolase